MFDQERDLSDKSISMYDQMRQPYAGIEDEIVHRERFLKDIPKCFLRIGYKEVGVEWKFTFCKSLADAQLEFYIGIFIGRFAPDGRTPDEVVVFVQ